MADLKLTELTDISIPNLEDIVYTVDDPSGSPVSNKVALSRLMGTLFPSVAEGRLTLVTGRPVYDPCNILTPSATDTTAETVDFAADHGWVTGTIVIPTVTVGGLTAGTRYYINATDTNTLSFHTTLADALAASSKVNLNASITCTLIPIGVGNTTLYYTPYRGTSISLYDGTRWKMYTFTERSLALSALTSGRPYDVWLYDNAGTLTLEVLAWTSDTVRATALAVQDGVYVKTGDTTRRYLGTIYTTGTDSSEDSTHKRYVWNHLRANRVRRELWWTEFTATWTYSTTNTARQANANANNQVSLVMGLLEDSFDLSIIISGAHATVGANFGVQIGEDSATQGYFSRNAMAEGEVLVANRVVPMRCTFSGLPSILGQHDYVWQEWVNTAGNTTFTGYSTLGSGTITRNNAGMVGSTFA